MVCYNGANYFYVYNLQGDVVALLDSVNKAQVVEYKYDAWGKPVACTGTLAGTLGVENPFRYRGYVYNVETGWYYLRSRYYAPEWGRFVNADLNLGAVGGALSHNSFTYCLNSAVCLCDPEGKVALDYVRQGIDTVRQSSQYGPFGLLVGLAVAATLFLIDSATKPKAFQSSTSRVKSTTAAVPVPGSRPTATPSSTARPVNVTSTNGTDVAENSSNPKNVVVFPEDPATFHPIGLVPVLRLGDKNGTLITWMQGKVMVFRWDEDPLHTPHYHINGIDHHFFPGEIVPEPYRTIYFP